MSIEYFGQYHNPTTDDANSPSGPTVSLTPPSNMVAGDFVLVSLVYRGQVTWTNSTTGGQTWSSSSNTQSGTTNTARLFWCVFNGTWDANPVFTVTTGTSGAQGWMVVWRGVNEGTPWDVTPVISAQTSSTTFTIATFDTVQPESVALVGASSQDNNTWTVDNSFTHPSGSGNIYWRSASGLDNSLVIASREFLPAASAVGQTVMTQASLGADLGVKWYGALRSKQDYSGQAQAHIKTVNIQSYAQGQAHILRTENGYAQAQASILVISTSTVYAQANAKIQIIGYGYAQARAVFSGSASLPIIDTFTRTVASGLGTAETPAKEWVLVSGTSDISVDGSKVVVPTSSQQIWAISDTTLSSLGFRIKYKFSATKPTSLFTQSLLGQGRVIGDTGNYGIWVIFDTSNLDLALIASDLQSLVTINSYVNNDIYTAIVDFMRLNTADVVYRYKIWKEGDSEPQFSEYSQYATSSGSFNTIGFPQLNIETQNTGTLNIYELSIESIGKQYSAQSQSQIKRTEQVWAQSNSSIIVNVNAYAQARVWIKQTYPRPFNYSQTVLNDAPIAYWRLGETSGTTANDEIGTADATYYDGATPWDATHADSALVGDANNGVSFDDYDYHLRMPSAGGPPATNFSIEWWAKQGIAKDVCHVWWGGGVNARIYTSISGKLWVRAQSEECTSGIYVLEPGNWYHIVFTYGSSPGSGKLYVNGVDRTVASTGDTFGAVNTTWYVGSYQSPPSYTFPAGSALDEVAIYDYALTSEQVKSHYIAGTWNSTFAQSNTLIKSQYQSYAQAGAILTQTYYGFGQSQAQIYLSFTGSFAQSLAQIGRTDDLYTAIDEAVTNDDDYIVNIDNTGATKTAIVMLDALVAPDWPQDHILRFRARAHDSGTLNVSLLQGAAQIASYAPSLTETFEDYEYRLTSGEITSITDYTDLRIRFEGTDTVIVSQVYFQVPSGLGVKRYRRYAQAEAYILPSLVTYNAYAQAQAHIYRTEQGYAQAQATILRTEQGYAQAQGQILQTYLQFAQANAQIKSTYLVFGQAQAQILQAYQSYAQAQTWIEATYAGYGQAQATVKVTTAQYANAQSQILQTYFGWAQANTYIILSDQQAYAQAQAQIRATYNQSAQANAYIYRTENAYAQSQALVQQTYLVYAQAQAKLNAFDVQAYAQAAAWLEGSFTKFAQAQAKLNAFNVQAYAQALAQIKASYLVHAQAQATIKQSYTVVAQALALIKATYFAYAQANTHIRIEAQQGYGQAQAQIQSTYQGYAQANAYIQLTGLIVCAQAQAQIKQVYTEVGQAQASILAAYQAYGQAQTIILATYQGYATAQGQVLQSYLSVAQAQATILQSYQAYAQANAYIQVTEIVYAQAQSTILQSYLVWAQGNSYIQLTGLQAYGQSGAWIKSSYDGYAQAQAKLNAYDVQQYAQAQAWMAGAALVFAQAQAKLNAYETAYSGQAQAIIKATYVQHAQSEAWIVNTYYAHGQAGAQIEQAYTVYAQAQAQIVIIITTYNAFGNAQALIAQTTQAYAQSQATIAAFGICQTGQAEAWISGSFLVYAQAQAQLISFDNRAYGQAQAQIEQTYQAHAQSIALIGVISLVYGQAQASLKSTTYGFAQALAIIEATTQTYAQAQVWICITSINYAQAQGYIQTSSQVFANAGSLINTTYSQYAQAQTLISQTYVQSGSAQALVKTTVIVYAQANSWIKIVTQAYGQAQGQITSLYLATGQANAYIVASAFGSGQAQASIIKAAGYGQAAALITFVHQLKKLKISDRQGIDLTLSDRRGIDLTLTDRETTTTTITDDETINLALSDRAGLNLILSDREFE